ncbi:MAG: winged helix-turn-helix transcriptional regulator [Cyclobacteriaceae bacterium]|nr:winged helix-turn-helix transcriptional regulator [Cyclobacteriaceae bacterium]
MGITRSDIFTDELNKASTLAKAFAHPARLKIITELIQTRACIVSDLVDVIGLSQPTISQHLKELKTIGIIKGEIEGPRVCYCINDAVWNEARKVFQELFDSYPDITDCC